jgi:hypothetical protein
MVDYHIWAAFANVVTTCLFSVLFKCAGVPDTFESLKMPHVTERFNKGNGALSLEKINKIMDPEKGHREIIKDPIAILCLIVAASLTTFSLPCYCDSYNNCDYSSMAMHRECQIKGIDCQAMCDVADMSLPPNIYSATTGPNCLNASLGLTCNCPLQGGWFHSDAMGGGPANMAKNVNNGGNIPTAGGKAAIDCAATVNASKAAYGPKYAFVPGAAMQFKFEDGPDGAAGGNGKICEGYDSIHGMPVWAHNILICWTIAMFFNFVAWQRWGCVDDTSQDTAAGADTDADVYKAEEGNAIVNAVPVDESENTGVVQTEI